MSAPGDPAINRHSAKWLRLYSKRFREMAEEHRTKADDLVAKAGRYDAKASTLEQNSRTGASDMTIISTMDIYLVVKVHGENYRTHTLDSVWYTKEAADKRAHNMKRIHNWIWLVVRIDTDKIDIAAEAARQEMRDRGIPR